MTLPISLEGLFERVRLLIAALEDDNAELRRQVAELRQALETIAAEADEPLPAENMYAPLGPFYRARMERMAETARAILARAGDSAGEEANHAE